MILKLAFCIDDKNGVSFFKRQSRDGKITEDLVSRFGSDIYITEYSLPLFENCKATVVNKPEKELDGCFFSELVDPAAYFPLADELYVYKWNRVYPADKHLSASPLDMGFNLSETAEFTGNSHDKITLEVYKK